MSLSKQVLHFYRHVLRLTKLMKPNEREYYRFVAKKVLSLSLSLFCLLFLFVFVVSDVVWQNEKDIVANSEEDDDTVQKLLNEGHRQIPWIMKKTVPGYRPPSSS